MLGLQRNKIMIDVRVLRGNVLCDQDFCRTGLSRLKALAVKLADMGFMLAKFGLTLASSKPINEISSLCN